MSNYNNGQKSGKLCVYLYARLWEKDEYLLYQWAIIQLKLMWTPHIKSFKSEVMKTLTTF